MRKPRKEAAISSNGFMFPTIISSPFFDSGARPEMGPEKGVNLLPVAGTEWIEQPFVPLRHCLLERKRVERFATNPAANEIKSDDIIPIAFQKMLKLDGLLRTDAPALTAAGA